MEVKYPLEKTMNIPMEKNTSDENFQLFVKNIVKLEVKNVFKSLSEEGVQAGKKEIEKSRRK
jgi:hypothetical protein